MILERRELRRSDYNTAILMQWLDVGSMFDAELRYHRECHAPHGAMCRAELARRARLESED